MYLGWPGFLTQPVSDPELKVMACRTEKIEHGHSLSLCLCFYVVAFVFKP